MPSVSEGSPQLENIVALCKRRGFIFPSADIYGGINGVYDTGPLGTLLKENIRAAWKASLHQTGYHIVHLDGALLGPPAMWEASGHVEHFHDPLVECTACNARFRTDDDGIDLEGTCPKCGKKAWSDVRDFHMMFKTQLGASVSQASTAYLRPETAQSVFVNFKNVMATSRTKMPFGIAQIGKAFRNEITPKQFLFRMREFEQMELEWFCHSDDAQTYFDVWSQERYTFYMAIGISPEKIRVRQHGKDELSHYSSQTSDVEYFFPFGWKELEGIADRGTYDVSQHIKHSGKDLSVHDEERGESYVPHVVECSVGVDRLFLTALCDAYREEETKEETRIVLKLHPCLAPIPVAFLPLSKKLSEPTHALYKQYRARGMHVAFDDKGSIGKRYRRYDEIGTPYCVTYDFDSEEDGCVTLRYRDSMEQIRVPLTALDGYLQHLTPSFHGQ